ncbi:DUF3124 domain-containing protein [Bradyrhizobium sp. LMTR 3]|uniref:DUF3124 domain-containing protein n=1 Tax=Bradyrhizobium sp. LMTR 3 TaxID=189873 RepID=UPI000810AFA4|nr:DUF3124 domain-containing protein [Bradyrhizobium sp. LMTR 3]OCK54517.1 hypothetical protein LMTR3_27010 [Bradyrhizobium sp. LMTR 3]
MGAFLAILAALSIPYAPTASARTAGGIEQNFANSRPLIPERIAYFDTSGKMAGSYLKSPIALKPLATVEAPMVVGAGLHAFVSQADQDRRQEPG